MSDTMHPNEPRRVAVWPRRFAKLGLLLASVAIMLTLFEVGFRIAGYEPIYAVYSKPSALWQADPLLGWSHRPSSREQYIGPRPWPKEFSNEIRTNSQGLRGEEVVPRREGVVRVLFLGDSMVAAFEVAEEETFVAQSKRILEARLDVPIEFINAGVRGYGTDQSYLYYRERGRALQPDLVVFLHSQNDFRNNMTMHRLRRPFGKPAFSLLADGELELQGVPVPTYPLCSRVRLTSSYRPIRDDTAVERTLCWLETTLADHSALFTFATLTMTRTPALLRSLHAFGMTSGHAARIFAPGVAYADDREVAADRLTAALIEALADDVEASGAHFVLWIRDRSLERLVEAGLRLDRIDRIRVALDPRRRGVFPIHFKNDSHWNAFGHKLIAETLAPLLRERIEALQATHQERDPIARRDVRAPGRSADRADADPI